MSTHEGLNPYFEQALAEHRELNLRIQAVRSRLAAAPAEHDLGDACADAAGLLSDLLVHLTQHFAQEEEGGYLEEAISLVPRLSPEAAVLERQHQPLLAQLRAINAEAETMADKAEAWRVLGAGFKKFSKSLLAHEAGENRIVQEACNCDLGMQD